MKHFILFVTISLLISSCWEDRKDWPVTTIKRIPKKCNQNKYVDNPQFILAGFHLQDNDSIQICEEFSSGDIDTFYLKLHSSNGTSHLHGHPERNLIKTSKYHLSIDDKDFVISELTTQLRQENTMGTKSIACHLSSYKINNKLFQDYGHIFIEK